MIYLQTLGDQIKINMDLKLENIYLTSEKELIYIDNYFQNLQTNKEFDVNIQNSLINKQNSLDGENFVKNIGIIILSACRLSFGEIKLNNALIE